ncbi:MAG: hypothetical protein BGO98_12940 [Myxococcales bacterium 68-20]|nr:OmpA family protein [Myxococcales bacterium]OJY17058.1 MAG: hypothetical protein BGO98_12940 [Myxococcales bacterium 68-20]
MTAPVVPFEDAPFVVAPALGVAGLLATAASATLVVLALRSTPPHDDAVGAPASMELDEVRAVAVAASSATEASAATEASEPAARVVPSATEAATSCAPIELAFAPSSTALDAHAGTVVATLAEWLLAHPSADLVVEGHADARGRQDINLWMSHARASTVASELVKAGVTRTRIVVRGFGAYQPVAGASETDGRQRRVVISIRANEGCPMDLLNSERNNP